MRVLFVNPRSGEPGRLDELRRAAEAEAVGVAGGDGSLAPVVRRPGGRSRPSTGRSGGWMWAP